MKRFIVILLFSLLALCVFGNSDSANEFSRDNKDWYFPGEFEEQEAVWLGWLSTEYVQGFKTDDVLMQIANELHKHLKVIVCVPDSQTHQKVEKLLKENNFDFSMIDFYETPFTMLYWRDYGPIFIKNAQNDLAIADFDFTCWGYYESWDSQTRLMEKNDRTIAEKMGIPSFMTRVVSEGGDRILNGQGVMITVEACEFQRNPNVSREELEKEYKKLLGVEKIIWLKKGSYEDDRYDTSVMPGPGGEGYAFRSSSANNHADEFCRFIDENTVLLAEITEEEAMNDPIAYENKLRMDENYEILKNSTDINGNPFNIVRIPMPETIYFEVTQNDPIFNAIFTNAKYESGIQIDFSKPLQIIPALSYCNFLISNGVVLGQKYWVPGLPESVKEKDEKAEKVLQELFPDREVIMINTTAINFGGGGIHCSTQQQPVSNYNK